MGQVINVKVLPGEPLDGSGRVCIHLFVQDDRGPFAEPCTRRLEEGADEIGNPTKQLPARSARGRLACDPRRTVAPVMRNGVTTITMRTDDPRAVTCLKCFRSADYTKAMELLTAAVAGK